MATQTQNYANEQLVKAAKLRTTQRHRDGWRPLHTTKLTHGMWSIVWNNDPAPPPIPPRSITQREFIQELATERNVRIN